MPSKKTPEPFRCASFVPLILLSVALALAGCRSTAPNGSLLGFQDQRLNGVLWFGSAEASAMYWQSFALAHRALDDALSRPVDKPRAIITDIDETILDNRQYQLELIRNRQTYSTNSWKKWTAQALAPALPGASNFLNYAAGRGVQILYVTNRDLDEADATLRNLKAAGFPQADRAHLFCKTTGRSKEDRRQELARRYAVCLLLGDNLADLAAAFDTDVMEDRATAVATNAALFGATWIAFPNPMYGDWERARPRIEQR